MSDSQPRFAPQLDRIVERVLRSDPARTFDELERKMKLDKPAHRASHAEIADALDESHDCAREADKLYRQAFVARRAFEIDASIILAGMRRGALAELREERKNDGKGAKAVTESDVEAKMAEMYPDEWSRVEVKRAEVEQTVEHLKHLSMLWARRASTLETLLRGMRYSS